jgi:hypothetical protein
MKISLGPILSFRRVTTLLEKLLGIFPGRQELEDDLRDQWLSIPHRQERLRLIHRF